MKYPVMEHPVIECSPKEKKSITQKAFKMFSEVDPEVFWNSFRELLKKPGSLPFADFTVGKREELAIAKWGSNTSAFDLKNGGLFRLEVDQFGNLIIKEAFLQANPYPENHKYKKLERRIYEFLFGWEWRLTGEFRDLRPQGIQELLGRLRKEEIEIKKSERGRLEIGFSRIVKR